MLEFCLRCCQFSSWDFLILASFCALKSFCFHLHFYSLSLLCFSDESNNTLNNWILLLTMSAPSNSRQLVTPRVVPELIFIVSSFSNRFLCSLVQGHLLQSCLGTAWRCCWREGRPTARVAAAVSVFSDGARKQWRICLSARRRWSLVLSVYFWNVQNTRWEVFRSLTTKRDSWRLFKAVFCLK